MRPASLSRRVSGDSRRMRRLVTHLAPPLFAAAVLWIPTACRDAAEPTAASLPDHASLAKGGGGGTKGGTKILFESARKGRGYGDSELYSMNADGSGVTALTGGNNAIYGASVSADGSRIAFSALRNGGADVFIMNGDGTMQTNLTKSSPSDEIWPALSPDGSKIAFISNRAGGGFGLYIMSVSAPNAQPILVSQGIADFHSAWSTDGTKLVFTDEGNGNRDIAVVDANGANKVYLTGGVGSSDDDPSWSPNGSKIAFTSNRSGKAEIWVMDANGANPTQLTFSPGASEARHATWSPDGSKILFASFNDTDPANSEIEVMNAADGSGRTNLTNSAAIENRPAWSPDGSKIAYYSIASPSITYGEIFIMDADGSNQKNLTNNPAEDAMPVWKP